MNSLASPASSKNGGYSREAAAGDDGQVVRHGYPEVVPVCAAVGCLEPVLEVWRPSPADSAPRFYYLVCQFHGLALRSAARYTIKDDELLVDLPARLIDWKVTESGGQSMVRLVYGDDLETVNATFLAEPAQLRELARSIASTYSDGEPS